MTQPTGRTIFQTTSKNGPIVVQNFGEVYKLVLNGAYVHSIYDPTDPITNEDYWDYLLLGRAFLNKSPQKMLVLGLGGGTVVNLYNRYFPPKLIDGVEINPEIIKVGKKYLGLKAANLNIIQDDAKNFIKTTQQIYDLIVVDVFKPTGQEELCNTFNFYQDAKKRLTDKGVVVVNHFDTTANSNLLKNFGSVFRVKIRLNQVYFCQKTKRLTLNQVQKRLAKLIGSKPDFCIFKGAVLEEVV
jgi:spermidine synthase